MSKQWNGSDVWSEFAKTAAESGLITSDLTPDEDYISDRQKDVPTGDDYTRHKKTEDYGVTKGEGKDIVEKAHPKDAQVAKSMGKGGLVENQVQQQEKDVEIALKMPDGAQHGVHAHVVQELVKLANELENSGDIEAAKRIDAALKEVACLPFDKGHLHKEAAIFIPLIIGLVALLGAGAATGYLSSMRDGLAEDAADLLSILNDAGKESASARSAANLLTPFVSKLKGVSVKDNAGKTKFKTILDSMMPIVPKLRTAVNNLELELGEERWYKTMLGTMVGGLWNVGIVGRTKEKFSDFYKSYIFAVKKLNMLSNKGSEIISKHNLVGIKGLQIILFQKGFKGKVWTGKATGVMDENTIKAAQELENLLTMTLATWLAKRGKKADFSGRIVKDGKLVIDPKKLSEILELAASV